MDNVQDYQKQETTAEEWRDILERRIIAQTKRLHALAVSRDGRAALGLSQTVSVLNPSLVMRVVKSPLPTQVAEEKKPFEYVLLNTEARAARDIRPPVVGHEVAFEVDCYRLVDTRKDTTLGRGDIAHVVWGSSSSGSVLFVVNGEGYCFAAVPRYSSGEGGGDGTWGGLVGNWRYKRLFRGDCAALDPSPRYSARRSLSVDLEELSDPESDAMDPEFVQPNVARERRRRIRRVKMEEKANGSVPEEYDGHFVESQIISLAFCRVFASIYGKDVVSNSNSYNQASEFVVFGKKNGAALYEFNGWEGVENLREVLSLHNGWSAVVACVEDVEFSERSMTLIAVGGSAGEVALYGVWFEVEQNDELVLKSEALWKSTTSLLFGSVSSLSWSVDTPYQSHVRLAVGAGNGITIVDWNDVSRNSKGQALWANPDIHRICDAHDKLVSSVQICVDGSFLSSSLDGTIYQWKREQWDDGGEAAQVMSCAQLQGAAGRAEPVMAMVRTVTGFGVLALTTTSRLCTEVNDAYDDPKYAAGARRSTLSLYVMPAAQDVSKVTEYIFANIDLLATTRRHVGEAITMWDVELFMEQFDAEEKGLLDALRQRFYVMVERVKKKKLPDPSKKLFDHYSRVVLCLSQVILRVGGTDISAIEAMERARGDVAKSVRCAHYDECMQAFLDGGFDIEKASVDECRALESMCQFASICKLELLWDAAATLERVREIRDLLEPRISRGESMALPCAICEAEMSLPLVSDAEDANSFYCSFGDFFTRCVLTGLPVADVVPLVCYCCDARALARDFDPYVESGRGEFGWIRDVGRCPLCMSPLLPSSVEMQ